MVVPGKVNVGAKRVMIVDGDGDSRSVYRIVLQYYGYEVMEADNGEAALAMVEQTAFDVVVTELTLRLVDGHTLVERLREHDRTRDTCIMVVTARGLQEDRERAEQAGCTRFLTKPLEPQALLREIEHALKELGQ
ncbi:N/A [soil metagenome]